jgi:glucose-1-phosphate cytidylyltransferase
MKVVILAGGFGTRLSEETNKIPKPMVEIGGKPVLWHIMKLYSFYGYNDFVICLGYKGYLIKEYFMNYFIHMSDITIDLSCGSTEVHNSYADNWKVSLIDTGLNTMTGGRIKRIKEYIDNETFMLTYGDGVSDVNIEKLVNFHREKAKKATVTAVQPSGRFGAINIKEDKIVDNFEEKPAGDGAWINGGFFVLEPEIFDYILGDESVWERQPLEDITRENQLAAYQHKGFWKPMDTLRDKRELVYLWDNNKAPWKLWE